MDIPAIFFILDHFLKNNCHVYMEHFWNLWIINWLIRNCYKIYIKYDYDTRCHYKICCCLLQRFLTFWNRSNSTWMLPFVDQYGKGNEDIKNIFSIFSHTLERNYVYIYVNMCITIYISDSKKDWLFLPWHIYIILVACFMLTYLFHFAEFARFTMKLFIISYSKSN